MKLTVPASIYEQMIQHCREGLPNEACGFLGGRNGVVERFYSMTNAAASPVYYRPDDKQMLRAMEDIDTGELELSAIFHSHVASPPRPSPTDVREAHYPDSVYVIVSMADPARPEAKCWLINKKDWRAEAGEIEEVELVLS